MKGKERRKDSNRKNGREEERERRKWDGAQQNKNGGTEGEGREVGRK